jgi:rare lipoprotein A
VVRVNDRGPFKPNRLIDLSYAAAAKLGIVERGTGLVEVEAVEPGATPPSPAIATAAGGAPDRKPRAGIEIISPAEAAPPPSPVARAPVRLYVQAGAFLQAENAVHRATGEDGRPWLRVRIGPLASVEEADRLSAQLTAHGVPNALIVVE